MAELKHIVDPSSAAPSVDSVLHKDTDGKIFWDASGSGSGTTTYALTVENADGTSSDSFNGSAAKKIKAGTNVEITIANNVATISASGSGGGTVTDVQVDGTSVVTSGVANIAKATASALGVVKPDGTTITIDSDGKITSTATGSVTSATINGVTKTPTSGVLALGNYVDKDTSTAQSINSQLSVESLYVGGTKVEVVSSAPASPVADTLYFITGS